MGDLDREWGAEAMSMLVAYYFLVARDNDDRPCVVICCPMCVAPNEWVCEVQNLLEANASVIRHYAAFHLEAPHV
jgi:hypothetical protein